MATITIGESHAYSIIHKCTGIDLMCIYFNDKLFLLRDAEPSSITDTSWIDISHGQGSVFMISCNQECHECPTLSSFNIYLIEDTMSISECEIQPLTNMTPLAKCFYGGFETQEHVTRSAGPFGETDRS